MTFDEKTGTWGTHPTPNVEKDIATLRALRRLEGGSDYWLERQERWRLWAIEQAKQGNPEPLKAYDENYAGELVLALQPARMLENLAAARTVMNPAESLAVMRPGERARSGAGVKLTPEPAVDAEAAERNLAAKNIREARNFLMENRPDLTPAQRNQVIRGFEPETLKITRLNEEVLDYRYYDKVNAQMGGRWSTPEWIDSPAERISRLALPNNLATEAATVKLRPGTTVFEGVTAPQSQYGSDKVGGAYQRYNALGPRALIEGVE
jgi:hypothetical protein